MKKKLLNTIIFFLFTISSFSQIEKGKIEKVVEIETKAKFPEYVPTENYINRMDYYRERTTRILESGSGENPYLQMECDDNEYYKRYNGLKIYFPSYPVDYNKNDILFFKKTDKIEFLDWTNIGNKYYTIIRIVPNFENFELYKEATNNFSKDQYDSWMLFELKDNLSNEIIYVVSAYINPGFILVPYFEKKKELINGKTLIALKNFGAIRIPLSSENFNLGIEEGSEWKGELTLLRKKDLKIEKSNNINDEEVVIEVLLSKEKEKAVFDLEGVGWSFEDYFMLKSEFEKLKTKDVIKNKSEENGLIKKYGVKFGKLVYQKKLAIGMSRNMCSDICGITLNRKNIKNVNGEIEIWEYTDILKLYFKNGKLSQIVKY